MPKFYFTYGTEGQPFSGGWTEVQAENAEMAETVFRIIHPSKDGNFLNCCSVYTEEQFGGSWMAENGNFGRYCQEEITLLRKNVICLKYIGRDSWSRPVYQEDNGTLWKDVDPRGGMGPDLCTSVNNAFDGEPCDPMRYMERYQDAEIRLIPRRDTWNNPIDN